MKARHKRLAFIVGGLAGLGIATALALSAFKDNMMFFMSPTQIVNNEAPKDKPFRLGGLVKEGTVKRAQDGLTVSFIVTDYAKEVPVSFTGILPDLFREGQGIVAQGRLGPEGMFVADEVLAKHDETYMAPEVAKALEKGKQAANVNMEQISHSVVAQ